MIASLLTPLEHFTIKAQFVFFSCRGEDENLKKHKHTNPSENKGWVEVLRGCSVRGCYWSKWGHNGSSAPHACMILMGGPAAGHPRLWEIDPAVHPSRWADCGSWTVGTSKTWSHLHPVGLLYVGLITSNTLSLFNYMDMNFNLITFYTPLSGTMQTKMRKNLNPNVKKHNTWLKSASKWQKENWGVFFVDWFHEARLNSWPVRINIQIAKLSLPPIWFYWNKIAFVGAFGGHPHVCAHTPIPTPALWLHRCCSAGRYCPAF